jgi:hypothetical protein
MVAGVAGACGLRSLEGSLAMVPGDLDAGAIAPGGDVTIGDASARDAGPVRIACDLPTQAAGDWTEIGAPRAFSGLQVTDVWAAGPDDVLFAGLVSPNGPQGRAAEIVRWTKGCWSVELVWSPIPDGSFPSLSGTGGDDIWVTAGDVLFHHDGTGWHRSEPELKRLLTQQHPESPLRLQMVRAAGPDEAWVIGLRTVWQRAAGQWRMFELADADLSGPDFDPAQRTGSFWFTTLWTGGRDDVAIGGAMDRLGRLPEVAFVYRYDGASWIVQRVSDGQVKALWGDGGGGLWIGVFNSGRGSPLFHLDGAVTESATIAGWPQSDEALALWGGAANDLWASGAGVLAQWDGQSWTSVRPPPAGNSDYLPLLLGGTPRALWVVRGGDPTGYFRLAR